MRSVVLVALLHCSGCLGPRTTPDADPLPPAPPIVVDTPLSVTSTVIQRERAYPLVRKSCCGNQTVAVYSGSWAEQRIVTVLSDGDKLSVRAAYCTDSGDFEGEVGELSRWWKDGDSVVLDLQILPRNRSTGAKIIERWRGRLGLSGAQPTNDESAPVDDA